MHLCSQKRDIYNLFNPNNSFVGIDIISLPYFSLYQSLSSLIFGNDIFEMYISGSLNNSSLSLLISNLSSFTANINNSLSGNISGMDNS